MTANIFYTNDYGSVGDGVTDDTAAINAALTAARTAGEGVVVIPPGSYKITDTLLWAADTHIWAHGAYIFNGAAHGFYMLNGYDSAHPGSGYSGGFDNIALCGGIWDAMAEEVGADDCFNIVTLSNSRNALIKDAVFRNVASYHAIDINSVDGVTVEGCRFEGFRDTTTAGNRYWSEAIQLDQGPDGTPVINAKIVNNYCGPAWDSSGLGVFGKLTGSHTDTLGQWYSNIVVADNIINGTNDVGIRASSWSNASITGNVIRNAGKSGIQLWQAQPQIGQRITVADNTIANPGNHGVEVTGASGNQFWDSVSITGNNVQGADGSGIYAYSMNNSTVSGNTLNGSDGHGIYLHNAIDNEIASNMIHTPGMSGVQVDAGSGNNVSGNRIKSPADRGVWLANSTVKNNVSGNLITGAGRVTPASGAVEISCSANNYNTIQGNTIQKKGSGTESAFPVVVAGATPARNAFLFNVFRGWSASISANYNLNGNTSCVFAIAGTTNVNGATT